LTADDRSGTTHQRVLRLPELDYAKGAVLNTLLCQQQRFRLGVLALAAAFFTTCQITFSVMPALVIVAASSAADYASREHFRVT
jgi:hypothetical protein